MGGGMVKCKHLRCSKEKECQYDPKYGVRWYLYRDGRPPLNDDRDYNWTGVQWVVWEEGSGEVG